MIATDAQARNLVCPLLAIASGKQTKCQASSCAFWRWYAGPGVGFEEHCTSTSSAVGGCGVIGEPKSQHILIALGKQRPRTSHVFGEPFPVAQLNRQAQLPPSTPEPEF